GIQVFQCRDCSNVCHEKCRPVASCKPCRRIDNLYDILAIYDHHGLSHPFSSSSAAGNNSGHNIEHMKIIYEIEVIY
ncbi:unnamed protein product, partial [Rotaria sp. Silwood2]